MARAKTLPALQFWQSLLSTEAPTQSRAFIETLGSDALNAIRNGEISPQVVMDWPGWTASERLRLEKCSPSVIPALGHPVVVMDPETDPDIAPFAGCFYQGDPAALDLPRYAIVGTRNATPLGEGLARNWAIALAESGHAVVSGGAYGIDAAAHQGAIAAQSPTGNQGCTLAVLANSLDRLYPVAHRGLYAKIAKHGGLVSPYAFGTGARPIRFLQRNGLIASLSQAVIVIEAPAKSGALHTVEAAISLGRPVFAIPGEGESFAGSMHAIKTGRATPVTSPQELLNHLQSAATLPIAPTQSDLSEWGVKILDHLTSEPRSAEALASQIGLPVSELLAEMTFLELDGLVVRYPTGYVRLN